MKLLIAGKGGISREVREWVGYEFAGYFTSEDDIAKIAKDYDILAVCIPIGTPAYKKKVYEEIKDIPNIIFPNFIHPSVKTSALMGIGNIICEGSILTCDIKIGSFNLINLGCTVGHDVKIGDFNVILPQVAISGNVEIGNEVLIGTNACIIQGKKIGNNSVVGMGSVVLTDVKENKTVVGNPARELGERC